MSNQDNSSNSTVLANATIDSPELNSRWSQNYKQRITEFYDFEGEDFRHFRALLESFFAINGTTQDRRKVIILKAQLRHAAAIFFSNDLKNKNLALEKASYYKAINLLQDRFLSKDLLEEYKYAFQAMKQTTSERPQMYLSRLHEAADLADIQDDKMIFSRFRADWNSNAWWNAHAVKPIHLVNNPFVSGDYYNGSNGIKFDSDKMKNDTMTSHVSPRQKILKLFVILLMTNCSIWILNGSPHHRDEVIAEIEILYLKEIKDIQDYKIAKPKFDYHDLKCNMFKEASDEHLNSLNADCTIFEEFIKDKVDISNVPDDLKSPFLNLLYEFEYIFDSLSNCPLSQCDIFFSVDL
ncbi:hypothetical protein INT48_009826 [Thamnidium elegans]|uniref:Uncharacterized protein n=1 Tax=Thamnidium elegans TaxID=101142 RepID=A0A8H7VPR2_9FUNG|nr:hypothetical protein INT48_009826 [Thamnidium elegans]